MKEFNVFFNSECGEEITVNVSARTNMHAILIAIAFVGQSNLENTGIDQVISFEVLDHG